MRGLRCFLKRLFLSLQIKNNSPIVNDVKVSASASMKQRRVSSNDARYLRDVYSHFRTTRRSEERRERRANICDIVRRVLSPNKFHRIEPKPRAREKGRTARKAM